MICVRCYVMCQFLFVLDRLQEELTGGQLNQQGLGTSIAKHSKFKPDSTICNTWNTYLP